MQQLLPRRTDVELMAAAPLYVRSIPLDIILTIVTCGLWNLVVQYKQMQAVNYMIGHEKYEFVIWLLLTLVTCGLYHIYHEFRKSKDIAAIKGEAQGNDAIVNLVLTLFGLSIVADALQQAEINGYFKHDAL